MRWHFQLGTETQALLLPFSSVARVGKRLLEVGEGTRPNPERALRETEAGAGRPQEARDAGHNTHLRRVLAARFLPRACSAHVTRPGRSRLARIT